MQNQKRPRRLPSRTGPLLLTREKLLDVFAAELGTFHEGVADAREHFLESGADLTLADLLGALLDPFGRLVHLGLVGGAGRPAKECQGREDSGSDPHPAQFPCHHVPPSISGPRRCGYAQAVCLGSLPGRGRDSPDSSPARCHSTWRIGLSRGRSREASGCGAGAMLTAGRGDRRPPTSTNCHAAGGTIIVPRGATAVTMPTATPCSPTNSPSTVATSRTSS